MPSAVWILQWKGYDPVTDTDKAGHRLALHVPGEYDITTREYHVWNCRCNDCARMHILNPRENLSIGQEAHWESLATLVGFHGYIRARRVSLFPVWIKRLKNKTLSRWLEEDVKDLALPMPRGIIRIIAMYALEPIVPAGDGPNEPPIFLDSDILVDFRKVNTVCSMKKCTCPKTQTLF